MVGIAPQSQGRVGIHGKGPRRNTGRRVRSSSGISDKGQLDGSTTRIEQHRGTLCDRSCLRMVTGTRVQLQNGSIKVRFNVCGTFSARGLCSQQQLHFGTTCKEFDKESEESYAVGSPMGQRSLGRCGEHESGRQCRMGKGRGRMLLGGAHPMPAIAFVCVRPSTRPIRISPTGGARSVIIQLIPTTGTTTQDSPRRPCCA